MADLLTVFGIVMFVLPLGIGLNMWTDWLRRESFIKQSIASQVQAQKCYEQEKAKTEKANG